MEAGRVAKHMTNQCPGFHSPQRTRKARHNEFTVRTVVVAGQDTACTGRPRHRRMEWVLDQDPSDLALILLSDLPSCLIASHSFDLTNSSLAPPLLENTLFQSISLALLFRHLTDCETQQNIRNKGPLNSCPLNICLRYSSLSCLPSWP